MERVKALDEVQRDRPFRARVRGVRTRLDRLILNRLVETARLWGLTDVAAKQCPRAQLAEMHSSLKELTE